MPTTADIESLPTGQRASIAISPALTVACITLLGTHSVAGEPIDAGLPEDFWADSISARVSLTRLTALTEEPTTKSRVRNLRLAALIEGWLGDESQHDEEVGPELDRLLHDNPPSFGE